jgi:hypothetical protein
MDVSGGRQPFNDVYIVVGNSEFDNQRNHNHHYTSTALNNILLRLSIYCHSSCHPYCCNHRSHTSPGSLGVKKIAEQVRQLHAREKAGASETRCKLELEPI